ncbi:hypothetical protein DVK85_03955 [Flavobacterium arcticum]|uniref:TonB C-terminal domain-containing protein n=1 Tax=Flavobacterium arcticum TaxID=1784713 RepID=A0A345HA20_9FLAO|nr:hypothetical protein [Flavobacterium arcticum]AXG73430.1 hypothetical protein DVK85_03955 [Flavobacterium arcticum]KAF2513217.1 hypothetical protein E0W72_02005 [Flavobacterium arcticum]
MKKTATLFTLILFNSCQWFGGEVPDKQELVDKRLEEINWAEVTSYPSIVECDIMTDKQQRKDCFFETMARLVQEKLDADTIAVLYPQLDTINVEVTIFADSHLEFKPQFENDSLSTTSVAIDSILKNRLVDFPSIEPAQKEGIPVTTQFILPVILNVE